MQILMLIGSLGISLLAFSAPVSGQDNTAPHAVMGGPARHMMGRLSPEDINAFADAGIAALRAGLKLSPDQAKLWPPVEDELRALVAMHLGHMKMMREGSDGSGGDPIALLKGTAARMSQGAEAMRKLAEAASPLYASLDEAQMRRLQVLLRGFRFGAMMGMGGQGMKSWSDGDEPGHR
jgi:zinc resistance-associated protein